MLLHIDANLLSGMYLGRVWIEVWHPLLVSLRERRFLKNGRCEKEVGERRKEEAVGREEGDIERQWERDRDIEERTTARASD